VGLLLQLVFKNFILIGSSITTCRIAGRGVEETPPDMEGESKGKVVPVLNQLSTTPILCDCAAIAYLRFCHVGQFFMEPSDYYDAPINKVLHFIPGAGLIKG
jgi:hypothetical protein